jgi:ribosomal protein S18 acetylase RimI-like enzyme
VIRKMNLWKLDEVYPLLDMQFLAYRVEADLIGFDDIPPLKDTISSLQSSNETFYGYFQGAELSGAISYTRQVDEVTICRLIVHPQHFRRGIGNALVGRVLGVELNVSKFIVTTGQKNIPAVQLYQNFGFVETGTTEISSGVFLSQFEKSKPESDKG